MCLFLVNLYYNYFWGGKGALPLLIGLIENIMLKLGTAAPSAAKSRKKKIYLILYLEKKTRYVTYTRWNQLTFAVTD